MCVCVCVCVLKIRWKLFYIFIEAVPLISQFDCYDVMMNGNKMDGVYTIVSPDISTPINVFCEISDDYGWLVSVFCSFFLSFSFLLRT